MKALSAAERAEESARADCVSYTVRRFLGGGRSEHAGPFATLAAAVAAARAMEATSDGSRGAMVYGALPRAHPSGLSGVSFPRTSWNDPTR